MASESPELRAFIDSISYDDEGEGWEEETGDDPDDLDDDNEDDQKAQYSQFHESDHPRAADGEFTSGGKGKSKTKTKEKREAKEKLPEEPTRDPYHSVTDFADVANELAEKAPAEEKFYGNKAFIEPLWRASQRDETFPFMSLAVFKQKLIEANQKGLLTLGRADMVSEMDPELVKGSETSHLNARFHFVILPENKSRYNVTDEQGHVHDSADGKFTSGGGSNARIDVEKTAEEVSSKLDPLHKSAIASYTNGGTYQRLNNYLRGTSDKHDTYDDDIKRATCKRIYAAINTHGVAGIKCSRGVAIDDSDFGSFMSNMKSSMDSKRPIRMAGFNSFSTDDEIAHEFAFKEHKGRNPVVIYVTTKKGLPISAISNAAFESEILVNHGARFQIERIVPGDKEDDTPHKIYAREV